MTDALFGQSYFLRFDPKLWAAMQPYPPLGTLYAASYLRERGASVALFDAMLAESDSEWADALDRYRPAVAVLYEDNFNYLSKMCLARMREAAIRMIAVARSRGATVVVAGSDATDHADRYLGYGADFVIRGEGEETLVELQDHLTGRGPALDAIQGLAYLQNGEIHHTATRPDQRDLDRLPFPAWDLVDVARYRAIWQQRHGYFSMNVATSRGCPFHCNWCAKPIWGQRYGVRSPENVVDEIRWLRDAYRPDHLWFVDDIFGLKPGWVQRFAELVEQQDARIPFKSLQRVDLLLKGDTVEALRRAGAKTVWVGAESGSQAILDAMDKGTRVEQIAEATRRLHRSGIDVGFFLQFGYPGETRADVEKTLQLVRDCDPDDIGVSVSYPLPGTKFHAAVQRELGAKQNWDDSRDLAMLYRGPFTTAYYRRLHRIVHREFRSRQAAKELRAALREPFAVRATLVRRAAALAFHQVALPLDRWWLRRLARVPHQPLRVAPQRLSADAASQPSTPGGPGTEEGREVIVRANRPAVVRSAPAVEIDRRLDDTRTAFDRVAEDYDGPRGNNALIQRMRRHLWDEVTSSVPPGATLLDLGCGTGLDAEYLASKGYRVVATDWSAAMVERTRRRIASAGLCDRVQVEVLGIQELGRLRAEPFDGIYSNLGPFNCVPDLAAASRACAALLAPGGKLVASVIGRFCPWEVAYYAARGNRERARVRETREMVPVGLGDETVWTRYYAPSEFYRAFAGQFARTSYRALGLFSPPPYLIHLHRRLGPIGRGLDYLDGALGPLPVLRDAGDHFLMVLTRRD